MNRRNENLFCIRTSKESLQKKLRVESISKIEKQAIEKQIADYAAEEKQILEEMKE